MAKSANRKIPSAVSPAPDRSSFRSLVHNPSANVTEHDIACRAYELYLARDREHRHDVDDWLQAERELQETGLAHILARTLLLLAGCEEWRRRRCVVPDVSQEIIVNTFMGKFKKLGFIEENSGVLQVNPARLDIVHDGYRGISSGASPATPQALRSEERQWPLAG